MSHNAMSASIGVERRRQIVRRHPFAALVAIVGIALSVPASSLALPPGRHYEMVSPVFKGGFGAMEINAVSTDGESVAFYSPGIFNGNPSALIRLKFPDYLARRGTTGWSTIPLSVPSLLSDFGSEDLSPDLGHELSMGPPAIHEFEPFEQLDAWVRSTSLPDTPETWHPTSIVNVNGHEMELEYKTSSADLCHAFLQKSSFGIVNKGNVVEPVAEAEGMAEKWYEVDLGCHGEPVGIKLVGVNNAGTLISGTSCKVGLGDEYYGPQNTYNAVSADGSAVFFTDCPVDPGSTGNLEAAHHQLFVRLGEQRTLEVSRPLETGPFGGCVGEHEHKVVAGEVPCQGATERAAADFRGASDNGSRVYFTAPLEKNQKPLVEGDTDASNNLYMAELGCPQSNPGCTVAEREVTSLSEVSHDPNNASAEVQGVLRIAPDGQRAYFIASGDLLRSEQQQTLEKEGRPAPQVGAANLYVYDSAAQAVSFVADLCTGTKKSGTAEDFRCSSGASDESLWTHGGQTAGESQVGGPHGEFFVFSTYGQVTSDDVNAARDVYRYNALTEVLTLVSHGENGYARNGLSELGSSIAEGRLDGEAFEQPQLGVRAISEDGSRIVFTSGELLSPADTSGLINAYEWHNGAVSLVSTGSDPEGVTEVVISADGSSVAFSTAQHLLPQDSDELPDVYVARLYEDFPPTPAERKPCEGDGCQGPLTNPAPLLVPGSVSQAPGENAPPPAKAKPKPSAKAKPKCKHGHVRDQHRRCVKRKRRGRKASAAGRSNNSANRGGRS